MACVVRINSELFGGGLANSVHIFEDRPSAIWWCGLLIRCLLDHAHDLGEDDEDLVAAFLVAVPKGDRFLIFEGKDAEPYLAIAKLAVRHGIR